MSQLIILEINALQNKKIKIAVCICLKLLHWHPHPSLLSEEIEGWKSSTIGWNVEWKDLFLP